MLLILPIIFLLSLGIIFVVSLHLSKKKKNCSCLNLPCGSTNDCGELCCNPLRSEKCIDGKCCSSSCVGLSCGGKNGCGENCAQYLCPLGSSCVGNECCSPQCSSPCTSDGCGGICPCPTPGDVCHEGECCSTNICESGICGYEKCGKTCTCNNDYCAGSCCKNGNCEYDNICETTNKGFLSLLSSTWGRFCQPSKVNPLSPQCTGCKLVLPQFISDGNFMSAAPIKGILHCDSCEEESGGVNRNVTPVEIDPNVQYYYNNNGEIARGPLGGKFCATQPGGCRECICHHDADCQRWGCEKCVGEKCV
jgi:hypothetical protein